MIDPSKPTDNALNFSELFMKNAYDRLDQQKANAKRSADALTKLSTVLNTFQASLSGLSSAGGVIKYQALLSNPVLGSVSVESGAQPGAYAFFVEQLATTHQLSIGGMPSVPLGNAGRLAIELGGGERFDVDLSTAKPDQNGNLSPAEMARVINESAGNRGKVSASLVTINGEQQMVLTSGKTGADGEITLDTSNIGDAGLRSALEGANEMIAAKNAVFYLGGEGGTRVEQSSNTFSGIQGVSVTFAQAMRSGDPALQLTVSRDGVSTEDNVKSFVNAYNELKKALDELTYAGNGTPGSAGPMAADAGVRALQQRLTDSLRLNVDGSTLLDFGVSADRNGVLNFDESKFNAALAADPSALNKLLGDGDRGVTTTLDNYLNSWLSAGNGQIKTRQESVTKIQDLLSNRETELEAQYNRVYERYLVQFNRLQMIDTQMKFTVDLLDNLKPDTGK